MRTIKKTKSEIGISSDYMKYIMIKEQDREKEREERKGSIYLKKNEEKVNEEKTKKQKCLNICNHMKNKQFVEGQGDFNENVTIEPENREKAKNGFLYMIYKYSNGKVFSQIQDVLDTVKKNEKKRLEEEEKQMHSKKNKDKKKKKIKKKYDKTQESTSAKINEDIQYILDKNYQPKFEKTKIIKNDNTKFNQFKDENEDMEDYSKYFDHEYTGYELFTMNAQRNARMQLIKHKNESKSNQNENDNNISTPGKSPVIEDKTYE